MVHQFSRHLCVSVASFCFVCGCDHASRAVNSQEAASGSAAIKPSDTTIDPLLSKLGTEVYPEGLQETNLELIWQNRIQAAEDTVAISKTRLEAGLGNINHFLDAKIDLVQVKLEFEKEKEKRLDAIHEGLQSALISWQCCKELQRVGAKGGEVSFEAKARSRVFKYRALWLSENPTELKNGRDEHPNNAAGEPTTTINDLLSRIGTGAYPEGLQETDLELILQNRIQAARDAVAMSKTGFEAGRDNVNLLVEAQDNLVQAKLEFEKEKEKRLDALFEGLQMALLSWQRCKELQRVGVGGGDVSSETKARSHVFKYRGMWLSENATEVKNGQDNHPAGEPTTTIKDQLSRIGTGTYPEGLLETNLKLVQQKRIQAVRELVTMLKDRHTYGLEKATFLIEAQDELVQARLVSEKEKEKRLDAIFEGLQMAILSWQRCKELQRVAASGGDVVTETKLRSQVFKYRAMWLSENAAPAKN